jgi:hypothetical protein
MRYTSAGVLVGAAILAGCSTTASQSIPMAAARTSVVSPNAKAVPHRLTGTHAIEPNCCANKKTLFVSDPGDNEVQMFDFPSSAYVGELAAPPEGFDEPQGLCSDNKGDVYVANTAAQAIDEFAHDGKYLRTLSEPIGYPVACAWDRSTGNLAVSNIFGTNDGTGSIAIYRKATGSPKLYSNNEFARFYFLSYMGKTGVLYFDGESSADETTYGSLQNGTITPITITGATIKFPGTVAYSPKTRSMNVGDQDGEVLYHVSATGAITGSTPLTGAADIIQGTIEGARFIGPDAENANVEIFAYPKGGNRKSTITGYFTYPAGSTVSST